MSNFITIAAVLASLFASSQAHAFLGADESTLAAVKVTLSPQSERIVTHDTHQVHEFTVGSGVVRAYVSPGGTIFAYTGHGLRNHPDPSLFGPYLNEFQDAMRKFRKGGRRPLSVKTQNIAVSISGPQSGLHWTLVLQSLPPGVTLDDIQ